jgi:hypothetical protein
LRPIKIIETSKRRLAMLAVGELILVGFRTLTEKKIKVPVCRDCWVLHRLGFVLGAIIVLAAIGSLFGYVLKDRDAAESFRIPVWVPLTLLLTAIAGTWIGVSVASFLTWHAAPVRVYRTEEGLLWCEFWSPRYHGYRTVKESDPSPHLRKSRRTFNGMMTAS